MKKKLTNKIKGFEGEDIYVSEFGEWVGNDYIDYKFEHEQNTKIMKQLEKEYCQKIKELKDLKDIDREQYHVVCDDLLVELLERIGYKNLTKLYQEEQEYFWYA